MSSSDRPPADDSEGGTSMTERPSTTKGRRPRSRMRRRITGALALAAALGSVGVAYATVATAATPKAQTVAAANAPANQPVDVRKGRQLYETSCITCHGQNLQGVSDRGPTLIGVGSASVYFQVSTGRMPAPNQGANELRKPAKFTEEQTRQLAAFVQSMGGGPQVPPADQNLVAGSDKLAEGGQLFRLNCASCHGATGHGAPLSAGKIAPSLTEASDTQIYTAMLSGPENMPVFSDNQITPQQKTEIVAYVQYLQHSK